MTTEIGDCPWAPSHKLVLIGARARRRRPREIAGRNIVLLIDVSGSMAPPERLPLIKTALRHVRRHAAARRSPGDRDLRRHERRRAAVDARAAARRDSARDREPHRRRIDQRRRRDSITAYRVAREAFIPGGVNRVILATDGDFNVGIIDQQRSAAAHRARARVRRVPVRASASAPAISRTRRWRCWPTRGTATTRISTRCRKRGACSCARRDATLETVAKDVKFQVEFNPALVARVEADRLREPRCWPRRTSTTTARTAARWAPATR